MGILTRRRLLGIFQLLITIILIGVLINKVQWSSIVALVPEIKVYQVILGLVLIGGIQLLNIIRWSLTLPKGKVKHFDLVSYYGAGLFSNNFLPTGFGGDGIRAALIHKDIPLQLAIGSVIVDRGTGILGLILFILVGVLYGLPLTIDSTILQYQFWTTNRITFVLIIVVITSLVFIANRFWIKQKFFQIYSTLQSMRALYRNSRKWYTSLLFMIILTIISQISLIFVYWLILNSMSLTVTFQASYWTVIISSFALLFPISINGLGLQENVGVIILEHFGISTAYAVGGLLIIRALLIIISIIGGLIFLLERNRKLYTNNNG